MRFLLLFSTFALLLSSPMNVLQAQTSENARISSGSLNQKLLSQLILQETNRYRVENGREPLQDSSSLETAARDHASAMASEGFFAHRNPVDSKQRTLTDRIRRVGLRPTACGENIAYNFSKNFAASGAPHTYRSFAKMIVQQWINSRGHRANLLGRQFSQIGLGFSSVDSSRQGAKIFCVQTFSSSEIGVIANNNGRLMRAWN